jgi:outer membrane biosynthesis protein TonB
MTSVLICMSLALLMQSWDRPAIESSDLAAPGTMQAEVDKQPETASEDLDSATLTEQTVPEVTTRWEYDEEGKPVARVEEKKALPELTPEPKTDPKPASEAPAETPAAETKVQPDKNTSGRIAIFWLLPPRR